MDRREALRASGAQVVTPEAARELVSSHFDVSPYEQIETMRQMGHRKAIAEGRCVQLEHQRHIMLATVANELAVAAASAGTDNFLLEWDRAAVAHLNALSRLDGG